MTFSPSLKIRISRCIESGLNGIRTHGLRLAKAALFLLSYEPPVHIDTGNFTVCLATAFPKFH